MDPAALGTKLASSLMGPLIRKLFVQDGPGAGLVDRPVRVSALVSFRGERRTLADPELRRLAHRLVERALGSPGASGSPGIFPGERPCPPGEEEALAFALADRLLGLGDLDMDDVQAVRLGHRELARELRRRAPESGLSADAALFLDSLTEAACLHILDFFSRRSTFVARTLVEQTRRQSELIAKMDELIARTPPADGPAPAFERRYLSHVPTRHGRLTIYGIDLADSPDRWPLDTAYLSLRALDPAEDSEPADPRGAPVAARTQPADQALADHDRVLLRGVAGSGKTTLVQWLAVTAARGERGDRIPFVLPLRTLVRRPEGLPAPDAFLTAVRVPFHANQPAGWADRVLAARRGLLLVDGLDEIPPRERERTRRWLRELLDTYPGNQWLVTSRPSAVREDWLAADGFTELALTPMGQDETTAFIARWHTAARVGATADLERLDAYERSLLDAVRTKPDLGRLATNPLMCGLICALHRDRRGFLPHGRQDLYDAALSMLLTRRDEERDMFRDGSPGIRLGERPQVQILQRLAYWLIRNNQSELDRERAERIVADVLPSLPAAAAQGDAPAVLAHLLLRSGLLREPAVGTVEFVHRTFQDYLGAKAAVEDGDFGLLVRGAPDEQWADVVRMAVAHARPRERAELLRDLTDSAARLTGPAATRVRLLALACLEHATELDPAVREVVEADAATLVPPRTTAQAHSLAAAGPIALELLPGPAGLTDDEARAVVVTASLIGTEAAVPVLARFRDHPAKSVRSQLSWTWHRFPARRYAEEVTCRLLPDGLFFSAHSAEHLRLLREMGGRPALQIVGRVTARDLRTLLQPDVVTALDLHDIPELRELDCLSALHGLDSLDLSSCPLVESLAPVAGLPLGWLSMTTMKGLKQPGVLSPFDGHPTLRALDVGTRLAAPSLDEALPQDVPLRYLRLAKGALEHTGLRGLHRLRSLKQLSLATLSRVLEDDDYAEIARLPHLEELRINWRTVGWSGPPLPRLARLRLNRFTGEEDVSQILRTFPGLNAVELVPGTPTTCVPPEVLAQFPVTPTITRVYSTA
ncbi:NACHT domain-containing protein [Streptomyces sp. NPDC059627]